MDDWPPSYELVHESDKPHILTTFNTSDLVVNHRSPVHAIYISTFSSVKSLCFIIFPRFSLGQPLTSDEVTTAIAAPATLRDGAGETLLQGGKCGAGGAVQQRVQWPGGSGMGKRDGFE